MSKLTIKLNEEFDHLLICLKYFCLDPDYEIYNKICQNVKIKNKLGDFFNVWEMSVILKYGEMWNMDTDSIRKSNEEINKLLLLLSIKPTLKIVEKTYYVFYATGDLNILIKIFETAGNPKASTNLKNNIIDQFEKYRNEFLNHIDLLLNENPDFFAKHKNKYALENSEVFSKFDKILEEKTKELDDLDYDFDIGFEIDEPIIEKPVEEKKENKEMKKASELFDDIAKSVMTKIKIIKH